jgi:hypothetical protein
MPRRAVVLVVTALTSILALQACKGFKDAMMAHVDVVANAGPQNLSVGKSATLLGNVKANVDRELVNQLAEIWIDYQLMGHAAALDDSLNSPKTIDSALTGIMTNARAKKYFDELSKTWANSDTAGYAGQYADGQVLAAKHILLVPPNGDSSPARMDSLHRRILAIRAQATPANFGELAMKNSQDPGSARKGGDLGVFEKGQMVPPFEQALVATKFGAISQPVRTQFGWHIIYRPTYTEIKDQIGRVAGAKTMQVAESTYIAHLDSSSKYKILPTGVATTRAVAKDPSGHATDKTVIATYVAGDFTAARLAAYMLMIPPQARSQIGAAPDSMIPLFVRNVVRNELVVRQADSAKVTLDTSETNEMRRNYLQVITNGWTQIGVDPKVLADSSKTTAGRDKLAAARVDAYIGRIVNGQVRPVTIPPMVSEVMRSKYGAQINEAGVDRVVSQVAQIRKVSDSAHNATLPPTAVPLPGGGGAGPGGAPAGGGRQPQGGGNR